MTCACCRLPATALITWISEPRADGSAAIKLAICLKCSERITENAKAPVIPFERAKFPLPAFRA